MRPLLPLALLLATACVSAQTYRWTDSNGRTMITDTPPPAQTKGVAKSGEAAVPSDGLPYATRRAMENFPVVLYTSPDCGDNCKQGREALMARGIPFTEKSLQTQEDVAELKQLVGDPFIPSLKVGRQSFRGFDAGSWHGLLDIAGYPKSNAGAKPQTAGQGK